MDALEFAEWVVEVISGRLDAVEEDFASLLNDELLQFQPASRWASLLRSMRPTFESAEIEKVEVAHSYLARVVARAGDRRHRLSARTSAGSVSSFSFTPQLPAIPWTDCEVPVGGTRLRVRDYGGAGQPVILFHCGLADVGQWDWMAAELPGRRVAVDLRAHGAWPADGGFDFDDVAHDVQAAVEFLGIDKPTLVGHSLGGYAALATSAILDLPRVITLDGPNRMRFSPQPVVPPDAPEWAAVGTALIDFDVAALVDAAEEWTPVLCDALDEHAPARRSFAEFVKSRGRRTSWISSAHAALVGQPGTAVDLLSRLLKPSADDEASNASRCPA